MAAAAAPAAAYVYLRDAEVAGADIGMENTIRQSLYWIGFTIDAQRDRLVDEAMSAYDDIRMLAEDDIDAMSRDFASRTVVAGKMIFGARRTKLLKAFVHWCQDFYRISEVPHIDNLSQGTFRTALNTALRRNEIRYNLKKQVKTSAEAASPGPLESERKWKAWEEKFINYTRAHIGANGIPLSYVIREEDAPRNGATYTDFISQTIECAPLRGEYYDADRLTVFNMIVSFTTGQPSGDWIKNTMRYSDGRRSMRALRDHFAGEGNASRNKADADRLYEGLHYKSERAMAFETFLTQCQKMFNIYEKEGEPMAEDARVRFLFKKVQHKDLQPAIEALQAQMTAGTNITYTMAANHLSTKVSTLPEYLSKNRNISGVAAKTGNTTNGGGDGIYNADGSINTGFIPHWRSLSKEDQDKVRAERKKLGITKGGKGSGNKATDVNRMKQLTAQNKKYKRTIKALKRKPSGDDATGTTAGASDSDSDTDAGDQFGGKHSKNKNKK